MSNVFYETLAGGNQDLQQVTDVGNVTTNEIIANSYSATDIITVTSNYVARNEFLILVDYTPPTVGVTIRINLIPIGHILTVKNINVPTNAIVSTSVTANPDNIDGSTSYVLNKPWQAITIQRIAANQYTILSPYNFNAANTFGDPTFTGATITIPHRLGNNYGAINTFYFASIIALNAATAAALAPGYWLGTVDATNMQIGLVTPVAVPINLVLKWQLFWYNTDPTF